MAKPTMFDPEIDRVAKSKQHDRHRARSLDLIAIVLAIACDVLFANATQHIDIDKRTRFAVVTWDWFGYVYGMSGAVASLASASLSARRMLLMDVFAPPPPMNGHSAINMIALFINACGIGLFLFFYSEAIET
ncbi:hypothetical protein TA3x_004873 [Tundrisphaera sp. TA3]|uniref:hypothetical protein n=1 Tax=Tundrisphaera sp. TA3 TaxID=3435775 RepID=UPI003EB89C5C